MDAVVFSRGHDERLWILGVLFHVLIGVFLDDLAHLWVFWVTVLRGPARTGEELDVSGSYQEWHLADHRIEEVGTLCESDPDEKSAVAAAHNAKILWLGHFAIDEVLSHREEVIIGTLAVLLKRCAMPARSEFAPPRILAMA